MNYPATFAIEENKAGEAGEAGEAVLHLLGGELGVAVLQVLALHQVRSACHFAHHNWVRLHKVEGTFLNDGRLFPLTKSYGHLEGICLWQVGDRGRS